MEYWGLVSKIVMHLSLIIHSANENFIDHNEKIEDNEIFISFLFFFFFRDCDPVILNNLLSRLINTLRVYVANTNFHF